MKIIDKLISKTKLNQIGFKIDEVMSGQHEFENGCGPKGYRPLQFTGTWGSSNLREWFNPSGEKFLVGDMSGTVTVGGLCREVPMKGRVELRYFKDHKIRYTFDFKHKNKDYHFVGEKVNIQLWNLPVSHTTCFGALTDKKTGKLISRSVTYFHLKTTPQFLGSLRFFRS